MIRFKWPVFMAAVALLLLCMAMVPSSALIPTPVPPPVPQPLPPIPQPPITPIRVFTEADNGMTVNLTHGTIFYVMLPSNPSTGFHWNLTVSPGLKVLHKTFIPGPVIQPGAGGYELWKIRAVKSGANTIKAFYIPPSWLRAPIKLFELRVNVSPCKVPPVPTPTATPLPTAIPLA